VIGAGIDLALLEVKDVAVAVIPIEIVISILEGIGVEAVGLLVQ
jgi:hypothetical protein